MNDDVRQTFLAELAGSAPMVCSILNDCLQGVATQVANGGTNLKDVVTMIANSPDPNLAQAFCKIMMCFERWVKYVTHINPFKPPSARDSPLPPTSPKVSSLPPQTCL